MNVKIDYGIYRVRCFCMDIAGSVDGADRMVSDLKWYINTGRASTEFLRVFCHLKGNQYKKIAVLLSAGGSTEETVARVKAYIDSKREG